MKKFLKLLGVLTVLVVVAGGVVAAWGWGQAKEFLEATPSDVGEERVVEIPRGAGPQTVSRLLAEAGVVTDAERFSWLIRYREAAPKLRAAELRFSTDQTPDEVLDVLLNAPEVTYSVTLAPGLRIEDMAAKVEEAGRGSAEEYTRLAKDATFIVGLDLDLEETPTTLEGLLVPETYSFAKEDGAADVLRAQIARFSEIWNADRRARAAVLDMTPYEVTVLASVVEKETGAAHERPLIAGVFHNRLLKGMRLESDPTIIYGLKDYDGNIRRSDIRRPHAWNTYVIPGLPPTPIAGPGVEAIDAVLHPAITEALFFVSKNDGTHHFSVTYREHARMVDRYQRRR